MQHYTDRPATVNGQNKKAQKKIAISELDESDGGGGDDGSDDDDRS